MSEAHEERTPKSVCNALSQRGAGAGVARLSEVMLPVVRPLRFSSTTLLKVLYK
jgi:hypothetical protein